MFWWEECVLRCLWEAYLLTIGFEFLSSLFGWGILRGVPPGLGYRWRSSREFSLINTPWSLEFSGSPVFQTQRSHATGSGLISGRETNQRLQRWLHPCLWLSSSTLTHWLPSFPPKVFPATISLPFPQAISPQSTAALTLGLLSSPRVPAPNCCLFQRTCSLD